MLGIEEAQPVAQPVGILDDEEAERAEAAYRVGRKRRRRFDLDHVGEARELRHPAEQQFHEARFRHHRQRRHRIGGHQQLDEFAAHPLARQRPQPVARDDAGMQPGGVGRATGIGSLEAEEAQDAQIVLGDAAGGIADEADPPVPEIVQAADVVVHHAVG